MREHCCNPQLDRNAYSRSLTIVEPDYVERIRQVVSDKTCNVAGPNIRLAPPGLEGCCAAVLYVLHKTEEGIHLGGSTQVTSLPVRQNEVACTTE